jgi:sterol desaturase/sphingolipid hydroxylase (fatty acid hydroxylase superfamily)
MDIQFAGHLQLFCAVLAFFLGHFLLIAGAAYLLVWQLGGERLAHRRIQARPRAAKPWLELQYSVLSILIFSVLVSALWIIAETGITRVYFRIDEHGIGWFLCSIAIMAVVHDTYYYFAHRLMHHRRVFRHVHLLHHSFSNPTPFASYAFHPWEALIEVAWFAPLVFLVPIHPAAFAVYVVLLTVLNVVSHLGHEFYPPWVARWFITSTHHNMHHSGSRGHYMLYFNIWDRVLRTNMPDYAAKVQAIAGRPAPARAPDVRLDGLLQPG